MQHGFAHARVAIAAIAAIAGCSSDANDAEKFTDTYQLNELNGSYGAFADEGSLKIYAAVIGPKGFLRLRGGDAFEVEVNGARVATTERVDTDANKVHYIADTSPPAVETDVTITFVRGLERVVRKTKLYRQFDLKPPPTTVKLGQSVEIAVEPPPDLAQWKGPLGPTLNAKAEVSGPCIETSPQQIDLCAASSPAGQCVPGYPVKLDAAKLSVRTVLKTCEVDVQVRLNSTPTPLEGTGPAKQTFKGGGFESHRLKSFKLALTE